MKIRPWYVSFTAILNKDSICNSSSFEALEQTYARFKDKLPFHHTPVNKNNRHFTVLPLLKIQALPAGVIAEDCALYFYDRIRESVEIEQALDATLCVQAYEVRAYDSGTCIQFVSEDESLQELRKLLREKYMDTIRELAFDNGDIVTELEPDHIKNKGSKAFASIARSFTDEKEIVRWKESIKAIDIRFREIYLLASDQYLSNPAAHDGPRTSFILNEGREKST